MTNKRWSRRELLKAGAGVALGGAVLETLSLRGTFDNRTLSGVVDPTRFSTQLQRLDTLDESGVLHIGQSTHLLSIGGVRVLTDPWFFDPAFGSLRHPNPPPIAPQSLGPLDVIAITHDHPDHADLRALDRMDKNALVIVGVPELLPKLRQLGFTQVEDIATWKELTLGALTITATPALHDVAEAGFVFSVGEQSIYFAGDTATHPGLNEIAERWRLSLAILPIDGTRLRWEPRLVMDPSDAANATVVLKPTMVMSSHADAVQSDWVARYVLSETVDRPQEMFRRLVAKRTPGVTCVTPTPGQLVFVA